MCDFKKIMVILVAFYQVATSSKLLAHDFRHEYAGWVNYLFTKGVADSGDDVRNVDVKGHGVDVSLTYGYIFPNLVQPIVEIRYRSNTHSIGSLKETAMNLEYGIGALFNVPLGYRAMKDESEANRFQRALIIPFGGIMLTKLGSDEMRSGSDFGDSSADEIVNKLIFGLRFLVANNMALSTSIRTYYHSETISSYDIDEEVELARVSSRLTIEARLLSFSLLL